MQHLLERQHQRDQESRAARDLFLQRQQKAEEAGTVGLNEEDLRQVLTVRNSNEDPNLVDKFLGWVWGDK